MWANKYAASRGAPFGGSTCLAGMPWRTRVPTPTAGSKMAPQPGTRGGGGLPPRLGVNHLLREFCRAGLGEKDHIQLPLGNRAPVQAHGRDVGIAMRSGPSEGARRHTSSGEGEGGLSHGPPGVRGGGVLGPTMNATAAGQKVQRREATARAAKRAPCPL